MTLSRFPPSSGAPHSRSLAQRVPLFRGEAAGSGTSHPASIKMPARLAAPAPASLRGLLLEVYGRSRGLLCAGGRKAGREPWLFAVCARRCTMCCIPAALEPRARVYPGFPPRVWNLGIAASRALKPPASISADKSVSCVQARFERSFPGGIKGYSTGERALGVMMKLIFRMSRPMSKWAKVSSRLGRFLGSKRVQPRSLQQCTD